MISIICVIVLSRKNNYMFHVTLSSRNQTFHYLPPTLGTITTLLWRASVQNLGRFAPYFRMARNTKREKGGPKNGGKLKAMHTNYVFQTGITDLPQIAANRDWLYFTSVLWTGILSLLVVPLKAVFLQSIPVDHGWEIAVSRHVGYTLIAIYMVLISCNMLLTVTLYDKESGLKWDPGSVTDQLALVYGSNIWVLFSGLDLYYV